MVNKVDLWALFNGLDISVTDEDVAALFHKAGVEEDRFSYFLLFFFFFLLVCD